MNSSGFDTPLGFSTRFLRDDILSLCKTHEAAVIVQIFNVTNLLSRREQSNQSFIVLETRRLV